MGLIQIKHAQIKFHLFGFWTVYADLAKTERALEIYETDLNVCLATS